MPTKAAISSRESWQAVAFFGELSHPAVVRSFAAPELPACVLVRKGIEFWRQPGLPDGEAAAKLLLGKFSAVERQVAQSRAALQARRLAKKKPGVSPDAPRKRPLAGKQAHPLAVG